MGGLVFSGLAATSFPGWWPRVLPAGGVRSPAGSPLACEGLGEAVRVALGQHQVGVVEQSVDGGGGEGLRHDGVESNRGWDMFRLGDPCYCLTLSGLSGFA